MNAPAIRGTKCFALRHNQSMRRLFAVLLLLATQCTGQSYDRLAGTAKLWNYVKYFLPRVTAGEIDWDAALMRATPKVLAQVALRPLRAKGMTGILNTVDLVLHVGEHHPREQALAEGGCV